MIFSSHDDDEDLRPDNFTNEPDEPARRRPVYTDPDDPFAPAPGTGDPLPGGTATDRAAQRRHAFRKFLLWAGLVLIVVLGIGFYLRYCHPYADNVQTTGYVRNVERRGLLFKTFEGELLTHESLTDVNKVYQRDFTFSVPNDSLAHLIQSYQTSGQAVTLTYERYYATLPWRGASKNVVTAVDIRDLEY